MESLRLSGNNTFLTDKPGKAYRVEHGHVLVFAVPVNDGIPGRRVLICECSAGEVIPGLYVRSNLDLDDANLQECCSFLLVPIEPSELIEIDDSEAIRKEFSSRHAIKATESMGFEEGIIETYRMEIARDARNTYAAQIMTAKAGRNIIDSIMTVFNRRVFGRQSNTPLSSNRLYDAASKVCDWMLIPHCTFEFIKSACGIRFSVWDYARVSGFICREVLLEDNWDKKDAGAMLAFIKEHETPVALIPDGKKYMVFNGETGDTQQLTDELASMLDPRGFMFYRPFPNKKLTVGELIRFTIPEIKVSDVVGIILLSLLATLVGLLLPYINAQLYDLFIPLGDISGLVGVCLVILSFNLGNMSFIFVKGLLNYRNQARIDNVLQIAGYERLFNMPESFYRKHESAELVMMSMGIQRVTDTVMQTIFGTAFSMIFSLLYIGRMNQYAPQLMGPAIILILISIAIILLCNIISLGYVARSIEFGIKENSVLYQVLDGIDKLRIAGAESRGLNQYMKLYAQDADISYKNSVVKRWNVVAALAMATIPSMVFYYIITTSDPGLSMGSFMGFMSAYGAFSGALTALAGSIVSIWAMKPTWDRVKPLREELPEKSDDMVLPGELRGDIEISSVSFGYREDREILHNINIHIAQGEYVAIVGPSGCGKSTLLKLLLGFEKPQSGKIYYDGKDIDAVDKRELRKKLGVVLQNGDTIVGSIYENITIAAPNTKPEAVIHAIENVGLKEDIDNLPMGLYTLLSEGAPNISGGQKQRILIARAIVNEPKILFFDEATSALDNRTQQIVCDSIEKLKCTKIVIAHRLSTIMNCDRILVMNEGNIVETGNYHELMEKKGLFYKLASRQIK